MVPVKVLIGHIKRYFFLGVLTLIPVALSFFIFQYVYLEMDEQLERLIPNLKESSGYGIAILAVFFFVYLLGIIISYLFGKRVEKMSRKFTNLFPHVKSINDELKFAQKLQQSLIPGNFFSEKVDIAIDYIPCSEIGGDFLTYHFYSDNEMIFFIGDVTGHGIPAAMLVNRIHIEIEKLIHLKKPPGVLLHKLDLFVKKAFLETGMYFSAFCGFVDIEMMVLTYSNYGHLPQYLLRRGDDAIVELESQTTMLGLLNEGDKIYQDQISLGRGDRIVLFTDGITETAGSKNKRYGTEKLKENIIKHKSASAQEFHQSLTKELWKFTEQKYEDDASLMTVDIKS